MRQMSHQIHLTMRILKKTRILARILRILLKTNHTSGSQIPGILQVLTHPKSREITALMIKAIRKVLTTPILTPMITPDHKETKGDTRIPPVCKSLGFMQRKPMKIGLKRKSHTVIPNIRMTVYPQHWQMI